MTSNPFPALSGDPRVDRALVALARLATEVVRAEQSAKSQNKTQRKIA